MNEAGFRAWLEENYSRNTVQTKLSEARQLDRAYGDLDGLYDGDRLDTVMESLRYSAADKAQNRPNPSKVSLTSDLYRDLSNLRTTVNYYRRYRGGPAGPKPDVSAVHQAIDECAAVGQDTFLETYGFGKDIDYWVVRDGRRHPSKAVFGVAHQFMPGGAPLDSKHCNGTAARLHLEKLGFDIVRGDGAEAPLERMKATFLTRMPDFESFTQTRGRYWQDEREYKELALARAREIADSALDDAAAGHAIYDALSPKVGPPLRWQTIDAIHRGDAALARRFDEVLGRLARSDRPAVDAVTAAAEELDGLRREGLALSRGELLSIVFSIAATTRPDQSAFFKISKTRKLLADLGEPALFGGPATQRGDVAAWLALLDRIFAIMRDEWGWQPRDLLDVQGFAWVVLGTGAVAGDDEEDDAALVVRTVMAEPTNLILYGPPGTGKTYVTAAEAVRLCGVAVPEDREELMALYRSLHQKGRIAFVTFHQNFSYEDFVEGLRPVTGTHEEGTGASVGFSLQPQDGIFKLIADLAASNRGKAAAGDGPVVDRSRKIFKMSLGRSWASEDDAIYQDAIRGGYVVLGWGGEVDWSDARYDAWDAIKERWRQDHPEATGNDPNMSQMYTFRINMEIGSLVVISDGNRKFRAVGEITGPYQFVPGPNGEYNHRRAVRWLWHSDESLPRELIYDKELSQVSAYQMNSRHLNWDGLEQIVAGGDATATTGAPEAFVLIIDEINRANISKVFGELITLLEPDKRLGMPNALTVRLPYSKQEFGVPANLHIVGTMNTADRSIALLDTALRRRFVFREIAPDPALLPVDLQGVPLREVLVRLNDRIEYLIDREHRIGHAFFIGCGSRADVDETMRDKVIPLLQEYFFEDWGRVAAVLGERSGRGGGFLDCRKLRDPTGQDGEGRESWSVRSVFAEDAYNQLLGKPAAVASGDEPLDESAE